MKKSIKKLYYWFSMFTILLVSTNANAQWSGVGGGVNNITYALCSDGTNLYVGINNNPFDNTNNYLLKWNGSVWSNLGYVNGSICALAYMGGNVYVGGTFSKANGATGYNNIAAWNVGSSSWSTLGTGTNSFVAALTVSGSTLYVGGDFTTANGVTSNYVASWSAGVWSTMNPGGGAGVNGDVWALTVLGGNLYVGGQFSATTSGTAVNNIVEWNGAAWSALTSGLTGAVTINNIATTPDQIAVNPDPTVMALTNDGTNLYVGGDFTTAGGTSGFHNIAEWNGAAWSKLGVGMSAPGVSTGNANGDNANVYALTMYNGNLIAGGDFGTAGTYSSALGIAQWNGSAWIGFSASCGSNINSDVFALCVSNGSLFAGGQFPNPFIYVAQYTGAGPTIAVGAAPATTICQGDNTGLSASGATTYTWSPSSSLNASTGASVTASPTVTTTYSVTGTTGGCSNTQTLVVTVNPSPTMTVTNSNPNICGGVGTSTLTITAGNATGYTWGPAGSLSATTGTSVTATPTVTTTYTVTATGANTCVSTQTLVVSVNPTPTVNITSPPPTICSGNSTVLSANGATTYSWSPAVGATTSTVSVSPGSTTTYTVTGTTGGCTSAQQTVVVTVNPSPTIIASGATTICSGNSTVISASGATTYTWSPAIGATTSTVSVSPGSTTTYTVTGTTAGCTSAPQTVKITVTPTPTVTLSAPPTICSGNSTTLTASGATTYTWTPGGSTGSTLSVSPGTTSTYTVTGANGVCTAASPATVVVTVNPTPTVTLSAPPTICSGNSTTLTANGASTYFWMPGFLSGSTVSVSPGSTTTYTVTGTASGCNSAPATIIVTVNATPTLGITGPVTICSGSSTTLTGSGASTYTWTPNTSLTATTGASVTANPASTITYTLNGTSAAACPAAPATVVVTVSSVPTVTVSAGPSTICSGSSSTLTATGATTYTWTPGALTGSTVSVSPGTTTTYTVVGTLTGCASSAPSTVTVTVNPTPTVSLPISPTICPGGSVSLTASGATTYTWTPNTSISASTGATITANPASTITYTVTGTSTGCTSAPNTVIVSVVSTMTVTITPTAPSICSGGSTTLTAGGAATYVWSPTTGLSCLTCPNPTANPADTTTYKVVGSSGGCKDSATYKLIVNPTPTVSIALTGISAAICPGDSMGMIASGASTYVWTPNTGLSCSTCDTINAGPSVTTTYTLTGTDAGGCSATATQVIVAYPVPVMTINLPKDTICSGNSVTLVASGVTSYSWSPPLGLNTTLGDSVIATPVSSTVYYVTGTGTGGCKTKDSSVITVNITPTVSVIPPTPVICSGDSIELTASGANTYQWLPNNGLQCNTCDSTKASPASATTYSVIGISLAGCKDTSKLPVNVNATPTITVTVSNGTTICSNKDTTVMIASGGTTYTWLPATGLNKTAGDTVDANPTTTVVYTVSTSSAAGCPSKDSITIAVNPSPTVNAGAVASTICNGTSTVINASGATTYTWIPATGLSSSTGATVNASPGTTQTYSVIGMTNGCPDTATVPLTVVAPPVVTATVAGGDSLCSGLSKTITASGGTTYIWRPNGQTTDSIVVSPTTSTTYTVVGSNGTCTDSAIVSLGVYPPFTVSVTNDTLCSGRTANITATATGGSAPYTYAWSNGLGNSPSANILVTPGSVTYTCNVSNACGQTFPATVVVDGATTPNAHFTATPDTIPGGQFVGFVNSNSGATSWIWTMGDDTPPANGDSSVVYQYNQPGTYWIKLIVSNGYCTDTSIESIFVTQGIFIPNVFTPNGDGQNDVFHVTVGGMKQYYIEIFNRWGERIFQADSPAIDWDGTSSGGIKESDGDYYYLINCTDFENTTFKYHGYIQLIRN